MTIEKTIEQIGKMHGDQRKQDLAHAQYVAFLKRQREAAKEKSDEAR